MIPTFLPLNKESISSVTDLASGQTETAAETSQRGWSMEGSRSQRHSTLTQLIHWAPQAAKLSSC